jgi:hypothetical protein
MTMLGAFVEPEEIEEDCLHDDHEGGVCIDCGEDVLNKLIGEAESRYEGDR